MTENTEQGYPTMEEMKRLVAEDNMKAAAAQAAAGEAIRQKVTEFLTNPVVAEFEDALATLDGVVDVIHLIAIRQGLAGVRLAG